MKNYYSIYYKVNPMLIERIRGSHHIFRKEGIIEKINLQRDGDKAKVYQVRQIREVILKYNLGGEI